MGYLTTVILHNDAKHAFEKNPEKFGQAILDGMDKASAERKQVDVGFDGYANYISVEPSRHADDQTIFVHYGNSVLNLNPYNEDFKKLLERPHILEAYVKSAEVTLKLAKEKLKAAKAAKKA